MIKKFKLGFVLILFLLFSFIKINTKGVLNNSLNQNQGVNQSYQPSVEEASAYQACSNFVKDKETLVLFGLDQKKQEKVYKDFLKDYENGNCGEIQETSKTDVNGNFIVVDPFNKLTIYTGPKELSPLVFSPYQSSLKKIQTKTKVINNYLVKNFYYTSKEEINRVLKKLYKFKFSDFLSVEEEKTKLEKISSSVVINQTYVKKQPLNDNVIQTKIFVYIAIGLTILSIIVYIFIKFKY